MKTKKILLACFLVLVAICTLNFTFATETEEVATITINNTFVGEDGIDITEKIMDSFYMFCSDTYNHYSRIVSKNGNTYTYKFEVNDFTKDFFNLCLGDDFTLGNVYYLNRYFQEEELYVYSNDIYLYRQLAPGENYEINITTNILPCYVAKSSKWINKEEGIAQVTLRLVDKEREYIYSEEPSSFNAMSEDSIVEEYYNSFLFEDHISDVFELSEKYYNDPQWKILESLPEDYDIEDEFYEYDEEEDSWIKNNIVCVFVKDSNTVFWCSDISTEEPEMSFEIKYKDFNKLTDKILLKTNNGYAYGGSDSYSHEDRYLSEDPYYWYDKFFVIQSPDLAFSNNEENTITVKKKANGFVNEKQFYVGLFESEEETKTDVIKKIEMTNGEGIAIFNVEDRNKIYYVYEVDSLGNKLQESENIKIEYKNNKVDFKNSVVTQRCDVHSDKEVMSSLISNSKYNGERNLAPVSDDEFNDLLSDYDNTIGRGEEYYIDNYLAINKNYNIDVEIINTETININLENIWKTSLKDRIPENLLVKLYANDEPIDEVILTADGDWKDVFKKLPKYDENGKEIKYTITANVPNEFESKISGGAEEGFLIVNTLEENPNTSDINVVLCILITFSSCAFIHNKMRKMHNN